LKELTYLHAEAFAAGELKHGPLALIDSSNAKSSVVILIILDDEYFDNTYTALQQIQARNALTIVITDCKEKLVEDDDNSVSQEIKFTKSQWLDK
jgi:glucosamine--fructose-6-phosphate aminotransferase (isomerizing)